MKWIVYRISVPVPIVFIRSKFSNLYSPCLEGESSSELSLDRPADIVLEGELLTGWETWQDWQLCPPQWSHQPVTLTDSFANQQEGNFWRLTDFYRDKISHRISRQLMTPRVRRRLDTGQLIVTMEMGRGVGEGAEGGEIDTSWRSFN